MKYPVRLSNKIEVECLHNIHDEVYYAYKNKIYNARITSRRTTVVESEDGNLNIMVLHDILHNDLKTGSYLEMRMVNQKELFKTKEDLIRYMSIS